MFDHVTIRVSDRAASERFYATVLGAVGYETDRGDLFTEWADFSVAQANGEFPGSRHLHVGSFTDSTEHVDAFWRAGVDAGCTSDGEPGSRPIYGPDYYVGFLLDPDGNNIEVVNHNRG